MKMHSKIDNRQSTIETRPWGSFIILHDSENCKIKRLILKPKKRFSLQYHTKRTETWTLVKGKAKIRIGDSEKTYSYGETVSVPASAVHRVENIGDEDVEIIEVQTGTYFGEDDITRIEDDFGRVT